MPTPQSFSYHIFSPILNDGNLYLFIILHMPHRGTKETLYSVEYIFFELVICLCFHCIPKFSQPNRPNGLDKIVKRSLSDYFCLSIGYIAIG